MKRLYNENCVPNKDGQEFSSGVHIIAKDLVKIARDNDLDLRDAQLIAGNEISVSFSEEILRRAAKRRKGLPVDNGPKAPSKAEKVGAVADLLRQIHDEADHIIGTEAEDRHEVIAVNAPDIQKMVKEALKKLEDL